MAQTNILLETGTNELEIVEFYVNQDGYEAHYGLNVAKVVEIGRRQTVTAMPEMRHKALLGAFPHRNGRIVPLIDMAQFLGSGPITNEDAKVIVTEFNTVCTGFLVSGVNRIYRLSWTDVEAPGNFLQNVSRSSVTGVVRLEERVIFLLDLEAIVAELHPAMAISFDGTAADTDGKTYNVLHVDDSSSIRSLVLELLSKEGRFNLTQRVNGQEAWDYLQEIRARSEEEGKPWRAASRTRTSAKNSWNCTASTAHIRQLQRRCSAIRSWIMRSGWRLRISASTSYRRIFSRSRPPTSNAEGSRPCPALPRLGSQAPKYRRPEGSSVQ